MITQPMVGAANASPVSSAAGNSSTPHADLIRPNAVRKTMKHAQFIAIRNALNMR